MCGCQIYGSFWVPYVLGAVRSESPEKNNFDNLPETPIPEQYEGYYVKEKRNLLLIGLYPYSLVTLNPKPRVFPYSLRSTSKGRVDRAASSGSSHSVWSPENQTSPEVARPLGLGTQISCDSFREFFS